MNIEFIVDYNCISIDSFIDIKNKLANDFAASEIKLTPFESNLQRMKKKGINILPALLVDNNIINVNPYDYESLKNKIINNADNRKLNISVIIPTLNEAKTIKLLLEYFTQFENIHEVIVADGGSIDGTVEIAQEIATVINVPKGRGVQMNSGAAIATGDIYWFLHADCRPHLDSVNSLLNTLNDSNIVGGAFEYNLNHPNIYFRITEYFSNRKNHLLKLIYGDMGIFVRRSVFEQMDGYKEIPLMEDMDFSTRLKKYGEIAILPQRIETSTRRWTDEGIIKNVVRNWLLQIAWKCGASPERLAKWYKFE